MKTHTTALAALILGLAVGPATACNIPDKALTSFSGKPVTVVQAAVARDFPACTLVLNGEVNGAFGFWSKPPQPPDYRWPVGTLVVTVQTGSHDASGNVDPVPRIFLIVPVDCEAGEQACAVPLVRQWPAPFRG
jgi:hypothetical protein